MFVTLLIFSRRARGSSRCGEVKSIVILDLCPPFSIEVNSPRVEITGPDVLLQAIQLGLISWKQTESGCELISLDTDNHTVARNRVGQRFSDIKSPHFFEIAVQRNHVADAIRHVDATKKVARSDVYNYREMYSYPRRRYGLNNRLLLVEYEVQYQKTDDEGLAIRGRFIHRCSGRLILLFHIHRIAGSSMGKGPKGIFLVLFLNPKMFLGSEYRTESTCFYALCSEPTCDQSPIS